MSSQWNVPSTISVDDGDNNRYQLLSAAEPTHGLNSDYNEFTTNVTRSIICGNNDGIIDGFASSSFQCDSVFGTNSNRNENTQAYQLQNYIDQSDRSVIYYYQDQNQRFLASSLEQNFSSIPNKDIDPNLHGSSLSTDNTIQTSVRDLNFHQTLSDERSGVPRIVTTSNESGDMNGESNNQIFSYHSYANASTSAIPEFTVPHGSKATSSEVVEMKRTISNYSDTAISDNTLGKSDDGNVLYPEDFSTVEHNVEASDEWKPFKMWISFRHLRDELYYFRDSLEAVQGTVSDIAMDTIQYHSDISWLMNESDISSFLNALVKNIVSDELEKACRSVEKCLCWLWARIILYNADKYISPENARLSVMELIIEKLNEIKKLRNYTCVCKIFAYSKKTGKNIKLNEIPTRNCRACTTVTISGTISVILNSLLSRHYGRELWPHELCFSRKIQNRFALEMKRNMEKNDQQ